MNEREIENTGFKLMQEHYRQRDLSAREWKEKGGKVVGYLCDNVPEEIIAAAGFFPFRLSGDPWNGSEEADRRLESMLHWDVNNGIARRSWARNEGAICAIRREMERTPLLQVTLPRLVDDRLFE